MGGFHKRYLRMVIGKRGGMDNTCIEHVGMQCAQNRSMRWWIKAKAFV